MKHKQSLILQSAAEHVPFPVHGKDIYFFRGKDHGF